MNNEYYQKNIQQLESQRNIWIVMTIILSISLMMQAIFLFWRGEKVVIVPAVIEKEFWVDSHTFSATYLEQMGFFLGKLALEKSAQSAAAQRTVLLRHTDPSYTSALQKKLLEEEQLLTKQNASYVFFPVDIRVNMSDREVFLLGDRTTYVSGKAVSSEREGYILSFSITGSKLLLKAITASKGKSE